MLSAESSVKNTTSAIFLFGFIVLMFGSCSSTKTAKTSEQNSNLLTLIDMMTGSFDSSAQAVADTNYYDISLKMFPIWQSKAGHYLYVEQAVSAMPDKPYRQRIYQLEKISNTEYSSKVFALDNQDDFIGKWASPEYFDQFDLTLLKEREGCTVYLSKTTEGFRGSTKDQDCKSTLRGASYATSIVTVLSNQIESWDQGFDEKGEQVWGAEKAGYVFVRNE